MWLFPVLLLGVFSLRSLAVPVTYGGYGLGSGKNGNGEFLFCGWSGIEKQFKQNYTDVTSLQLTKE